MPTNVKTPRIKTNDEIIQDFVKPKVIVRQNYDEDGEEEASPQTHVDAFIASDRYYGNARRVTTAEKYTPGFLSKFFGLPTGIATYAYAAGKLKDVDNEFKGIKATAELWKSIKQGAEIKDAYASGFARFATTKAPVAYSRGILGYVADTTKWISSGYTRLMTNIGISSVDKMSNFGVYSTTVKEGLTGTQAATNLAKFNFLKIGGSILTGGIALLNVGLSLYSAFTDKRATFEDKVKSITNLGITGTGGFIAYALSATAFAAAGANPIGMILLGLGFGNIASTILSPVIGFTAGIAKNIYEFGASFFSSSPKK